MVLKTMEKKINFRAYLFLLSLFFVLPFVFSQTYNNTYLNSTFVQLNLSSTNGDYYSSVIDTGAVSTWQTMSWECSHFHYNLPDNQISESTACFNIDMTYNVMLLHMDESSGNIKDSSGFANDCTVIGGVTYSHDSLFNKSLYFDGTGWMDCGNDASLDFKNKQNFAISVWVYLTSIPTHPIAQVFDKGTGSLIDGYGLAISNTSLKPIFQTDENNGSNGRHDLYAATNISLNQWHNIVVMVNNSIKYIYIDGKYSNSAVLIGEISEPSRHFKVGIRDVDPNNNFDGYIDELVVFNDSLTASEITDLYKRGATNFDLYARGCTLSDCSDGSFVQIPKPSPQGLSSLINPSQYFQYKSIFNTINQNFTAKLYVPITLTYSACYEDWKAHVDECLRNDSQLIYYTDQNNCGTYINIPADNGTYVPCTFAEPNRLEPYTFLIWIVITMLFIAIFRDNFVHYIFAGALIIIIATQFLIGNLPFYGSSGWLQNAVGLILILMGLYLVYMGVFETINDISESKKNKKNNKTNKFKT